MADETGNSATQRRPRRPLLGDSGGESAPAVPHRVVRRYAYIGGQFNRGHYVWEAGEIVKDADEIAHLKDRGVSLEPIDDGSTAL